MRIRNATPLGRSACTQAGNFMADPGSAWTLLDILLQITLINIVLSGDNAVVIALACRSLPPQQQKIALLLGNVGIVVARTIFTAFATYLLSIPYLELTGAAILLWISVRLQLPDEEKSSVKDSSSLIEAVKTIVIADIVMSLDNVLGMAGAARGHLGMLVLGLVMTIPLILFFSAVIMELMRRLPFLVTLGAALLGYVAGEMAVGDPAVDRWVSVNAPYLDTILPLAGAALVVLTGKALIWHRGERAPDPDQR
jgi:YjbE family integral membrane protein